MSITSVRLQPDIELELQNVVTTTQRSKNWIINQALREFIDRQAVEQKRWKETLQAIESVSQGKIISGEAVSTWLETWGTDRELPPPEVGQ